MKNTAITRAFSLFVQGYLFGSKFGRFEFRRSFWRPWLNSLGAVGAWLLAALGVAVGVAVVLYGARFAGAGALYLADVLNVPM